MALVASIRRSKPIQILIFLTLCIIVYLYILPRNDSFTPEELNSLLQNKGEAIVSIKKRELTAQGLTKPYLDASSFRVKNWDLKGNTLVKNNQFIRLTSENQHQVGNMFSKLPIQAESFEMELTFHLHSKSMNGLVADGFAIWFIDKKSDIGDVFGAENNFNGLGIFIDTYRNGKRGHFPFINLMLGDGHTSYDKNTDGFETRLAGCTAKSILNPASGETKARIVYIKDGYFSLDFNYRGKHEEWTNCVTLSNVKLPPIKYLGFTAETGDLSENVDIIENKIYALYKPNGKFIESIDELESLMNEQHEYETEINQTIEESKNSGARNRLFKKKSQQKNRKSLKRLKNAEKRIKEKERKQRLEKYGDENANFFNRMLKNILYLLKVIFYTLIIVCLIWVAFIIFRVQGQRRKSKVTGLLD